MLEKLKDASKLLAVLGTTLYLLGFICITGYYAQFGIVTFDIINARFLIDGFNALVPLVICIYISRQLFIRAKAKDLFENFFEWLEQEIVRRVREMLPAHQIIHASIVGQS